MPNYRIPRYTVQVIRNPASAYNTVKRCLSSRDAVQVAIDVVAPQLQDEITEGFWVVILDTKLHPIGTHHVSQGTLDSSLVHPREVFRVPITLAASSIITVHNHPTGDCTPSRPDLSVHSRLKQAGDVLGIAVLDSIIIGYDIISQSWKGQSIEDSNT